MVILKAETLPSSDIIDYSAVDSTLLQAQSKMKRVEKEQRKQDSQSSEMTHHKRMLDWMIANEYQVRN